MKETKHYCDRCGKEIKPIANPWVDIFKTKYKVYRTNGEYHYDDGEIVNHGEFELCNDCAKSFMRWLKDEN